MYEVRCYRSIKDDDLKEHWLSLQCGSDMTAFQTYDWYEMLEEEYQCNKLKKMASRICYMEVWQDQMPVLIAPLHIQKHTMGIGDLGYKKSVYLLGMKGYTDYLNLIYDHISRETVEYLFYAIKNHTGQSTYRFVQIPENTEFAAILREYEKKGMAAQFHFENCVKVCFPATPEEYAGKISKNLKSSLRRQTNKYEREGIDLVYDLIEGICNDESVSKRIADIHNIRFKQKNKDHAATRLSAAVARRRIVFDEIQYSMHHNKDTWLLLGKNRDEIIVYFYGLKDRNAIRIMQLGFAAEYAKYMPGNMTMMKFIRDNFEGLSGFIMDFTRGEERYKYELGGIQHKIVDYVVQWI